MNVYVSFYLNNLTGKTARKQLHVVDNFVKQEAVLSDSIKATEWSFYALHVLGGTAIAYEILAEMFVKNLPFEVKGDLITFSSGNYYKIIFL
jgi:hypothetical protein